MRVAFLNKICLAILLGILGTAPAWGQEGKNGGADEERHLPAQIGATETCPCTFGPLITDTAVPIETGKFAIQPMGIVRFTGGSFSPNWRRVSARGDFVSLELPVKFTYGPVKNMEVYSIIAYRHNWAGNVQDPGPNGERHASYGGLRDINLTLKYQLLEETDTRPTVSGVFSMDFPTGHSGALNPGLMGTDAVGSGSYVFYTGLNLSKWVKPFILYGNLWYAVRTPSREKVEQEDLGTAVQRIYPRDVLYLRLAAEYPLGGKGPWVALLEFYSEFETGRIFGHRPNADTSAYALMGFLPGLEYIYSDKLAFAAGVAIELAGKNASFEYTPIFSFTYIF